MMFEKEFQQDSLLFFYGPITVNFISFTGNYIQSMLFPEKKLLNDIFRVFVELTQNVSYYSAELWKDKYDVSSGVGWFSVRDLRECYSISTGNLIKIADAPKLDAYCTEINSLSMEERHTLKRKVRETAMLKDVNARLGLIQISIASRSDLKYEIKEVDKDHSFFIISADINKK